MSQPITFADLLKLATVVSSISGLSMLLVNSSGELQKCSISPLLNQQTIVTDVDEFLSTGVYRLGEATANFPYSSASGSMLFHLRWDNNAHFQIVFCYQKSSIIFRVAKNQVWQTWKQVTLTALS